MAAQLAKVLGGATAIVAGACVLAYATTGPGAAGQEGGATLGIAAALGAGGLWGTMYIPYRKAYISGMNPLSFVTVFSFGELGTVFALAAVFDGGVAAVTAAWSGARPALFWLFLGGFCWVIGDLFQQYAGEVHRDRARNSAVEHQSALGPGVGSARLRRVRRTQLRDPVARGRGIGGHDRRSRGDQHGGAADSEQSSWRAATERECGRYGLDRRRVAARMAGEDPLSPEQQKQRWWEPLIVACAVAFFLYLAAGARRQALSVSFGWMIVLIAASAALLVGCGFLLWKRTRFS